MIPMDQKEAMDYRIEKAIEIGENFIKLHTEQLSLIRHNYGKAFLFTPTYFKIRYYARRVAKFESEMIAIIERLKTANEFMMKHEYIWEFNDHLAAHKELLVGYYNFSGNRKENEGDTIFNVYTYGGNV